LPASKRGSTRHNMLVSAAELMRERGAAGVTIDGVLARSKAPRGSVYYHFPGGRNQILADALRYAGEVITLRIDTAVADGAQLLMGTFVDFWAHVLVDSDYAAGCPVVAAATASTDDEPQLTEVAGEIFSRWRDAMARAFERDGFDSAGAQSLATMCIASLEGAVVLCRATRSSAPLREVAANVEFLIKAKEFVLRNGFPATSG
jgi:TetR/AcrR family transcriptional regulator, lmrAB and yxaGH operons repressor